MIDFHTHVLPEIDDGSRSSEESHAILKQQKAAGTKAIVASSHFYPDKDLETFVQQRSEALSKIQEYGQELGIEIRTAAEVLLSVDTWKLEGLEQLAIEGTHYILLEMPYSHWSEWVYTSVAKIKESTGLIPIIAHVERYDTVMENPNCLQPFLDMGCIIQVNTVSLHKQSTRRKLTCKLVKHGFAHVLGSDVHRAKVFNSVAGGYETLEQQVGKEEVSRMQAIGAGILADQMVSLPKPKPFKKILGRWY